jgi:hypothetical protein
MSSQLMDCDSSNNQAKRDLQQLDRVRISLEDELRDVKGKFNQSQAGAKECKEQLSEVQTSLDTAVESEKKVNAVLIELEAENAGLTSKLEKGERAQ